MQGDVAVRMAGQPGRAVDREAAQHERLAGAEGMAVGAEPDPARRRARPGRAGRPLARRARASPRGRRPRRPGTRPPSSIARARSRSTGTVTFRLVASPLIAWTGDSTGLQQRGLVGPGLGAVRRVSGIGTLQQAASHALGSLGRHDVRSVHRRADADRLPARLSVSLTGSTGIAAPWPAVASATARTSAGLTSGRAASWTRITGSGRGGPAGPRPWISSARPTPPISSAVSARAATPAATDSCRRGPPATTATTESGSQSAAAIAGMRAGEVTMTIRSTPAASSASTDQRRIDRPSSSASSLSRPPMRRLAPAATMTASIGAAVPACGLLRALTPGAAARRPSGP